jgi:hypothetical protein
MSSEKRFPNQKDDNKHFLEIIKKNRPNLSLGSLRTYMSSIRRIQKDCDCPVETIDDIIKHKEEIVKTLGEKMTAMIRKTKISGLIVILDDKDIEHDNERKEALEFYRKVMSSDADIVSKRMDEQELTESQKENLISQDDVMKVFNQIRSQALPLLKLEKLNKAQFELLQSYVLLSLYTMIPPRRSTDYTSFKIRNFSDGNDSVDNYMTNFNKNKRKGLSSFVFNTYKNSTRLGRQIIEIPKTLERIIETWKQFNKSDWLLVNSHGNPVTQTKIVYWLNDIFGKNISSSLLRHIFLTSKYSNVNLKELKNDTAMMGNAEIQTSLQYVQKPDES